MTEHRSVVHLVRSGLQGFTPYEGVEPPEVWARRVGVPPERLVKLDANENPYGPSPRVAEALASCPLHIYPDPLQRRLREALASYAGTTPDRIVAGVGSDEVIDLLVRLFVEPGEKVMDLPPTFGMYAVVARVQGGVVVRVPRDEAFEVDLEAVRQAVDGSVKVIFLTSPNNPTGNLTPEPVVRALLELGPLVVVDEAYHEFSGFTVAPLVEECENLVVLRTLSKWAALAGLRVGYGIMDPRIAERLLAIKAPYNVSVAAETAVLASLEDTDLLLHRVRLLVEERERMTRLLREVPGVHPLPSKTNFVLCRFPPGLAPAVKEGLARRGVLVRSYFGEPRLRDHLRISVGRPQDTDALISALQEVMEEVLG